MVIIKIQVDAGAGESMAIKEALAMLLEKWGDAKVVEITETEPEQLKIQ